MLLGKFVPDSFPTVNQLNQQVLSRQTSDAMEVLSSDDSPIVEDGQQQELTTPSPSIGRFLELVQKAHREVRNQVALHANRVQKRSGRGKGTSVILGRSINIVPDRLRVTLKLGFVYARASAAGPGYLGVVPSNLLDPGSGLSANTPYGFTQWITFYQRWIVMKSRIKIEQVTTTSSIPTALACAYSNESITTGGFDVMASQARSWTRVFAVFGTPAVTVETPWMSHSEMFGLTEDEFRANEDYYGDDTPAAPTGNIHFSVLTQDTATPATAIAYQTLFVMEFEAEFCDRQNIAS